MSNQKNASGLNEEDTYQRGYDEAINDIINKILSYSPKSQDFSEICAMRRCRDDIARKIDTFMKTRHKD